MIGGMTQTRSAPLDLSRMRRPPTHPGDIFRLDFREPSGISQAEAARRVGWTANRMNEFERGRRALTPENAVMIAALTGASAEFWMGLQARYDLWHAMERLGTVQVVPLPRR